MAIEKKEVRHIAKLSRLALSEEEMDLYSGQLSSILGYVEKLNELDTRDVEPTSHIIEMKNVMREDRNWVSLTADEALSNAPDRKEDFYRVPRIIE
jgi:aspartyl-tRNA(Asn)/glutamyl-tRNA(Gln) amidotransferase subunit C